MDNGDEETFDRPEGYTCTQPHQVCAACAGRPRVQVRPSRHYTRRALDLLSAISRWAVNIFQVERWLSRLRKPQISHTDVEEAVQHLDRTDDGL